MSTVNVSHTGWLRRPIVMGFASVLTLAVGYPLLADRTQQPLGIFIIPILFTCALGSWLDTVVVGVASLAVAVVEGLLQNDLDGPALAARVTIITVCWLVAIALSHERIRRERVADASISRGLLLDVFQDSLVPEPIPPAGVVVHTRYLPGDERLQLGGDFFDAIRLPNGCLGYIMGDVCGHGPRAAAFGAAVRSGWKTLATTAPTDPLHWVKGLDKSFFRLGRHADTFVTLNTGFVELENDRRWSFVSAGHPWPIVMRNGPELVEPAVGPPLGVGLTEAWSCTYRILEPGTTVLLYTDGLIENATPDHPKGTDGERRLLAHLKGFGLNVDQLLATFGPDGFDDDVAIMTITVTC